MTSPTLSICIPTYNREFYLKRLLDGLLPQVKNTKGKVNLYISDNASTDGTEKLCHTYVESGYDLTYSKNHENMGADFNVSKAFMLGDGKYVWVLGDDEFVYCGTINIILSQLMNTNLSILYLNYERFIEGVSTKKNVRCSNLEFSHTAEQFVRKTGVFLTFISAVITNKKELFDKEESFDPTNYFGTYFVQLSWVFTLLKYGSQFAQTKKHMLAAEPGNTGGYPLYKAFGTNLSKMTTSFFVEKPIIATYMKLSSLWLLLKFNPAKVNQFNKENVRLVMNETFSQFRGYKYLLGPMFLSCYRIPYFHLVFRIISIIRKCLWRAA